MTYPLIGNYGCNVDDFESSGPKVEGFVVREYSQYYSNWRADWSLSDFLEKHGVVGIQGVDTRALTRRLRMRGVMNGVLSTTDLEPKSLVQKAKAFPGLKGIDMVKHVTCQSSYLWRDVESIIDFPSPKNNRKDKDDLQLTIDFKRLNNSPVEHQFKVIAMDFGVKLNILRLLHSHGCDVTVVPAETSADEILASNPDGIVLSNGPGDPEGVPYVVETVRNLIGTKPIFGICLGHQILGLAFGGRTYKLKFGHRGANQPVKDLATGKVAITAQNHGFCVDIESLNGKNIKITHINLNDNTLEGMQHEELPIFSVQYHPEASPGPHDADYLFARFIASMKAEKEND